MTAQPYRIPPQQIPKQTPEKGRQLAGWLLYGALMAIGGLILLLMFIIGPLIANGTEALYAMVIGALFALPLLGVYIWVPWIIDRYDPEPTWALVSVLAWGAIAACGFSALINTVIGATAGAIGGENFGQLIGSCFSAPLVEEFWKGLAVFWMFYFRKRDFDGVVDGIIYGAFAALGFAAVENIIYYARAADAQMTQGAESALVGTVFIRGVLAPWGHPLYTAMTGIGFGLARETEKPWVRWAGPICGYFFGVFLHFTWNLAATISNVLVLVMLPLWFLFLIGFTVLVIWCVKRKGKIIADHLKDEVLMGNLTFYEFQMITSPFGRMRASYSYGGSAGRKFVDAAARLALSKWHTGRATRGRKLTISADFIVPLRQELFQLRNQVAVALRRAIQQPTPWRPGQPSPFPVTPYQLPQAQRFPQAGRPPGGSGFGPPR
jgi:protease PrsW